MASNKENDVVTMDKLEKLLQKMFEDLRNEIKTLEDEMEVMNAKLDGNIIVMNRRYAIANVRFVKKETVLKETNIEVNRIELTSENNEVKSYSGTPTTTNYECTETINVVISEHEVIDEQSDLETVHDTEVDWDEDIVFDHSTIESKPIVTEQQFTEVRCLHFHPKYSFESLVSTTQQEVKIIKYVASDVEVSSANVLNVETELNSFAQYEEILPRKVWDPGLDNILL